MIKVIGIGQSLRGDDEAGLAAVRLWTEQFPQTADHPAVEWDIVESPGLALLEDIRGCESLVLVDAAQSGSPPGTVQAVTQDQLAAFVSGVGSAHGFGLAETLALGRTLYPDELPTHLILIVIEVQGVATGTGLSKPVQAALPAAARLIQDYVTTWLPNPENS